MSSSLHFDVSFKKPGNLQRKDAPRSKIIVMGNFSGQNSGSASLLGIRTFSVDCDNFEERMRQLSPCLDLAFGDTQDSVVHLEFGSLEDFHPDRLYERVELFNELRSLRKNLLDPKTFSKAAKQITGEEVPVAASRPEPQPTGGSDTFAELLGKPVIQDRSATQLHPAVSALLRKFVTPHVVDEPGPEQDRLVESVDTAVSEQMRAILHHEEFQSLEAAWRSLDYLVRELELDECLTLHILDLSKSQLAAELAAGLQRDSWLYKTFITEAGGIAGTEPWDLIVGLYDFTMNDTALLNSIGDLARQADTTLMSGISYESVSTEADQDWENLRRSDAAAHLCLASPGLLLRLPYGANTDEIDCFEFEEVSSDPVLRHYLWGSAGLVCGVLLGKTLGREGVRPGSILQLDGLPVHTYRARDEYKMTPCGGAWLSDSDANRLIRLGITPVLSVRNSDAVRLLGFQSLAGGPISV